jgi:hypothetical protein
VQNATRRYRGKIYNINFIQEIAKVVRFIDYIVGRITHEFEVSHPREHVRKEKQERTTLDSIHGNSVLDIESMLNRNMVYLHYL